MTRKPWAVKRANPAIPTAPTKNIAQFNSAWERKIWYAFSFTKDEVYRQELILHYKAFGEIEAWSYINTQAYFLQAIDKLTIVSDAMVGLIEAIDAFNPAFKVNFQVFSRQRIRGAIIDGLRSRDNFPRIVAKQRRIIRPLMEKLAQRLHRQPTPEEFCQCYGDTYRQTLNDTLFNSSVCHATSLKSEDTDSEVELTTSTAIARHGQSRTREDVQNKLELMELANFILHERGDTRLQMVMNLYYFGNKTTPEIATILGLSQSSVVNGKAKAIELLRRHKDMFHQFLPEGSNHANLD